MDEMRSVKKFILERLKKERLLRRPVHRWEDNIKTNIK
jgi:hypothetical protein